MSMLRDTFGATATRQLSTFALRFCGLLTIFAGMMQLPPIASGQTPSPPEGKIDFAHQVVPILKQHCAECHGDQEAEGGFSLNTRELFLDAGYATPGMPTDSYLLELVKSDDPDLQMPPANKPRVSAE